MADKRLRTMVFPGLEDTYTIPQDMNDLESIDAVAEPYDEFTAYAIGDYCSNGGKLYRCNTAIPSGEVWNANHWTSVDVAGELKGIKGNVSGLQDGLAIVAEGNTHAAIASGQFVYVKNHGSLAEGLYTATTAIAANAALSTSNLTADTSGGLNALKSNLNDKVSKSGDTMSGNLTMDTGTRLRAKANFKSNGTYSTNQYADQILLLDTEGNNIGYFRNMHYSGGNEALDIIQQRNVNGTNVFNSLQFAITPSGTKVITISDPAAWRAALELGSNGAFPIAITQGGTGSTAVASTATIAQIATAASGFTFSGAHFSQWGKIGILRLGIAKNVAWSGAQTAGTVVSGKRTITQCALVCYTSPYVTGYLDQNGAITINSATTVNANVTHYFYAIYFLA